MGSLAVVEEFGEVAAPALLFLGLLFGDMMPVVLQFLTNFGARI